MPDLVHARKLIAAMKHFLKEPLVHFLLLGVGLFVAYSVVSDQDQRSESAIVVSAGKIEPLSAIFSRTWQRPPTHEELEGLIQEFVHDEAAYRDGVAAGLDRDDVIIRRRIRQKLEFIAEDLTGQAAASDEELAAYLASHPDEFREAPRLSFRSYRASLIIPGPGSDHLDPCQAAGLPEPRLRKSGLHHQHKADPLR